MAITRAQIAKQLLAQGGRIGLQGGGRDAGKDSDFGQEDFGGPKGGGGDGDRNIIQTEKQREFDRQTQRALTARFGDPDPEVDVITANRRDTATNFLNNLLLNASVKYDTFDSLIMSFNFIIILNLLVVRTYSTIYP